MDNNGKNQTPGVRAKVIKGATAPIGPAQLPPERGAGDWLEPGIDQRGLYEMVRHSTILPQCIEAYALNIAGFGLKVQYREDRGEDAAMAAEYERLAGIIRTLSPDRELSAVFGELIRARETYGIAYLEVIRDMLGNIRRL